MPDNLPAKVKQSFADIAPKAIAWGLSLLCPGIPQIVWLGLIYAVIDGRVLLEDLQEFLKLKTDPEYIETPGQKAAAALPEGTTNTNLDVGHAPGRISEL